MRKKQPRIADPKLLALGSTALLLIAFPRFNQSWAAWVALVPWLLFLRRATPRQAFRWSFGIGFGFFLSSMWWMVYLTKFGGGAAAVLGWVALSGALGVYFGLFGMAASVIQRSASHTAQLVLIPSAWVALEYARSHLLSGLGWNLLGYSQSARWHLIQFADVTGVWGVSFLIVLVNVSLVHALRARHVKRAWWRLLAAGMACVAAALWYGEWRVPRASTDDRVRFAVVQGNIPQDEKWDEAHQHTILARYEALTREAAADHPQLIIWPETAVPGYFGLEEAVTQPILRMAKVSATPMLVGAPMGRLERLEWRMTNSAALVNGDGELVQRYDKVHLVPFGEFVPFERQAPWLRTILPAIGEFQPGRDFTVFGLKAREDAGLLPPFSVLICFEDLFPEIGRRFVRQGAKALLVITNDAWFGPTAAAYQHLQASVFRAVEMRVPVVRAANTGWSGCIDPTGWEMGRVHDGSGKELFVSGTHTCDMTLGRADSLYVRFGDWLPWLCWAVALGWLAPSIRRRRT